MAGEDPKYLERVRALPCMLAGTPGERIRCVGIDVHAHHDTRGRGVGQRAHDHTAIPLCFGHHRAWHDLTGFFAGWNREQRASWSDVAIAEVQKVLLVAPGERRLLVERVEF